MRAFFSIVVAVAVALACGPARADGLFYQLPDDGVWAQYEFKMSGELQGPIVAEMEGKGSIRMASIGRATEKDEPCRWIEVSFDVAEMKVKGGDMPERPKRPKIIVKVLIPERHLKAGQPMLDHAIRGWTRQGNLEPRELKDPKNFNDGPLPVVLAPPLKDVKRLDEVVIEGKLGKLSCAGVTGRAEYDAGNATMHVEIENRLHRKAPFGVVTSRWKIEGKEDGKTMAKMTFDFRLGDFGDGAKSELPDQN
ncbi:MAG: hypothetical protein ACYTG0_17860 [Planctomycetota bacterium]|jgi:hypothetical protein